MHKSSSTNTVILREGEQWSVCQVPLTMRGSLQLFTAIRDLSKYSWVNVFLIWFFFLIILCQPNGKEIAFNIVFQRQMKQFLWTGCGILTHFKVAERVNASSLSSFVQLLLWFAVFLPSKTFPMGEGIFPKLFHSRTRKSRTRSSR